MALGLENLVLTHAPRSEAYVAWSKVPWHGVDLRGPGRRLADAYPAENDPQVKGFSPKHGNLLCLTV